MSSITDLWAQPRVRLWAILLGLLLLALVVLLFAMMRKSAREPAEAQIVLRVVDAEGAPVTTAEIFVHLPPGSPPEAAGLWSQKDGTLTLPDRGEGRSLIVQASGFQTAHVPEFLEDRTLVLPEGLLLRIRVAGDLRPVEPPLRVVFSVRPAPEEGDVLSDEELAKLVQLMKLATPLEEGEQDLPRGTVGVAAVETAASRGILVPMDGRYAVRWGLFDPRAGVWFSPQEGGERYIRVRADERAQVFEIALTQETLDKAQAELARRAGLLEDR